MIVREDYQHDKRKVQRMQKSLYLAAKERGRKFYTLYDKVCDWDVLVEAWRRVKANGGKGGIDGMEISDLLMEDPKDHGREVAFIRETQQMLREKRYTPLPVRRVYIRKQNGKLRPLGIPALRCRLIQAAAKIVLESIFEAQFADSSYGFRPERSAKQASRVIRDTIREGYWEVVDLDLADYFGSIPHKELMERVSERIKDGAVLRLIRSWLEAGYVEDGTHHQTPRGTPQGGVASPLLSNLYLDVIDHLVEQTFDPKEVRWVRYADDAVLLCKRNSLEVYSTVKTAIEGLGLTVNTEKFQVLVCYKYDRLSRNTRDFLHILDTFDRNGVAFVSVTQPIDTTSSVGRLMRSILMDFSQFEREMISERTRDKMAAMARRGKRTGGYPVIGFDIDRENKRLRINPKEAEQVKAMFNAYLQSKSLSRTAKILNGKGHRMKAWVTQGNKPRGGQKFTKAALWYLLQNPLYIGKITYRKETLPGEHEAIIPEEQFQAVQKLLRGNGHGKVNKQVPERTHAFLLRGLVECACCKTTMTPSSALPRKKGKVYGRFYYYKCLSVVKMDKTACEVRSVSAKALEEYVVRRLELLGQKKDIVERIVRQSQEMTGQELPIKRDERKRLSAELGKVELEARNLVGVLASEGPQSPMRGFVSERLAELEAKRQEMGDGLAALDREIERRERRQVDSDVVRRNLGNFLKLFGKLTDKERVEIIGLLVKRVVYDGEKSRVQIALRPLPEAWGDLDHLEGGFYGRKTWLPD